MSDAVVVDPFADVEADAAHAELERALAEAVADLDRFPERIATRLGEAALIEAVAGDRGLACRVLRALSALAWRGADARALAAPMVRWPDDPLVARWRARLALDLTAAAAYRDAYQPVLPPYIFDVVADLPVVGAARRAAVRTALRAELRRDVAAYLDGFEVLTRRCPDLAGALLARLLDDVPEDRRVLDALPPPLVDRLGERLRAIRTGPAGLASTLAGTGAAALGVTVAALIDPMLGLYAGGGAGFSMLRAKRWAYQLRVRQPLARVLVEVGVTRACVREWLRTAARVRRLSGFNNVAGEDDALRLVGMVAGLAAVDDDPS